MAVGLLLLVWRMLLGMSALMTATRGRALSERLFNPRPINP